MSESSRAILARSYFCPPGPVHAQLAWPASRAAPPAGQAPRWPSGSPTIPGPGGIPSPTRSSSTVSPATTEPCDVDHAGGAVRHDHTPGAQDRPHLLERLVGDRQETALVAALADHPSAYRYRGRSRRSVPPRTTPRGWRRASTAWRSHRGWTRSRGSDEPPSPGGRGATRVGPTLPG